MSDPFEVSKRGEYAIVDSKGKRKGYRTPVKRAEALLRIQRRKYPEAYEKTKAAAESRGYRVSRFRQHIKAGPQVKADLDAIMDEGSVAKAWPQAKVMNHFASAAKLRGQAAEAGNTPLGRNLQQRSQYLQERAYAGGTGRKANSNMDVKVGMDAKDASTVRLRRLTTRGQATASQGARVLP
jgi:hypothetical protein